MYFFVYRVRYWDEMEEKQAVSSGIICAESYSEAAKKLEEEIYFGVEKLELRSIGDSEDYIEIETLKKELGLDF